jgi:hypothetical protein
MSANLNDRSRRVIRVDGTVEQLPDRVSIAEVERLIHANTLDTVKLRHLGPPLVVMFVDDLGHAKDLPVNPTATRLYWETCRPGTVHQIRGDVVIVLDDDYGQL